MFISNINKYHLGNIKNAKKLIDYSIKLGCNYVKINKYHNKNENNGNIETPLGLKSLNEYYNEMNFSETDIKELVKYTENRNIKFYAKVEDIESLYLMSKYTDICEIDIKLCNYNIFNIIKKNFKTIILRVIEPDITELEHIFYSYNPDIIIIDTKNLKIIEKIKKKIGKIKLGYRGTNDVFYIPALIYGCTYFEKELNLLVENNCYDDYNKLIKNIKLIEKEIHN